LTGCEQKDLARQPERISNRLEHSPLMVSSQNAIPVHDWYLHFSSGYRRPRIASVPSWPVH